ncbi:MAG: MBL fold metallo-hydrolase [Thermoanaerobaculia bacterium]|nr:MBL fold metallo-hydrolase [Thermoanaerobaculia bacterium]
MSRHPSASNARLPMSRREMLALSGLLGLHGLFGRAPRAVAAPGNDTTVAKEPWGRIDRLAENLWAIVSDPLGGNYLTVCNGGIVAGKDRVLVVEAFVGAEGARWVCEQVKELTGRWPTDVVISHYHGDHANGLAGFATEGESPTVWVTDDTRRQVIETAARRERTDAKRKAMLESAEPLPTDKVTTLDLGGRKVSLHPRSGHTSSDVTVEIEDPSTIFWGDLLWVGMFPNYRDATPSVLAETVRSTLRERTTFHVTGHGPVATPAEIRLYQDLIDDVEKAARLAFDKGIPPAEAAKTYKLPTAVSDWHVFQDNYFESAISAWHHELGSDRS